MITEKIVQRCTKSAFKQCYGTSTLLMNIATTQTLTTANIDFLYASPKWSWMESIKITSEVVASGEVIWLDDQINSTNLIQRAYLFGSFLVDNKLAKDVDVMLLYSAECLEDVHTFVKYSTHLQASFLSGFQRSLHVTAFAPFEMKHLPHFLRLCGRRYPLGDKTKNWSE